MDSYIALNGWTYCGFGGERKPREFIDWASERGLDGVELTVGDCLSVDTTREEAAEVEDEELVFTNEGLTILFKSLKKDWRKQKSRHKL